MSHGLQVGGREGGGGKCGESGADDVKLQLQLLCLDRRHTCRCRPVSRCRRRFVGRGEVTQVLERGRINTHTSTPTLSPCPKYAVDAAVVVAAGPGGGGGGGGRKQQQRQKRVRAVFAACPRETRLITVIDTDTNWACGPC